MTRTRRHDLVDPTFKNEREFQAWIIDFATDHGWRVWHAPMPMRPAGKGRFVPDKRGAGLPDLFLMHDDPPRLVMAEVKVDAVLSDAQREFLALARQVADAAGGLLPGVDNVPLPYRPVAVFVWRPANRHLIEAVLRGAPVGY